MTLGIGYSTEALRSPPFGQLGLVIFPLFSGVISVLCERAIPVAYTELAYEQEELHVGERL